MPNKKGTKGLGTSNGHNGHHGSNGHNGNGVQLKANGGTDKNDKSKTYRPSSETDRAIELRARDRQRKLISKIDAALHRIEDGTYGYCEDTGDPIALKRLEARPIATLSVEAQERHERRERVYRDD
jgi:RNA polymerase-binding protein DksA